MVNITKMGQGDILSLRVEDVTRLLTPEEFFYIANTLGAYWQYDYEAARTGKVGLHAELKSGLHSDGFFISRILLEKENMRRIMAKQIAMRLLRTFTLFLRRDYIAGVPDGATSLGKELASLLHTCEAHIEKRDGKIFLNTEIGGGRLLLIEDFCTRGTGFAETVENIKRFQPHVKILPYNPVILNRGGLRSLIVKGAGIFEILPVVEKRIQDWPKGECPLCNIGSKPIKPKATDENWRLITTSQL